MIEPQITPAFLNYSSSYGIYSTDASKDAWGGFKYKKCEVKDEPPYGLLRLKEAQPSQNHKIDIVAVHGLGGHWTKTWTDKNDKLWLRDFLPTTLPGARVMSYGYNSNTAFSKSVSDIEDASAMLLNRLNDERESEEEKKRPIIFISHSLGGIIVKKALILAHERSSFYSELLNSVKGVVFFGVPHRGSDIAYWGTIAASITNALQIPTNTRFISALKRDSKSFANISQQFIERAVNLEIRTFYEMQKMSNQLIVDRDSASLGLANEIAVGIEGANHRDICKFEDARSQKYRQVDQAIKKIANSCMARSERPVDL